MDGKKAAALVLGDNVHWFDPTEPNDRSNGVVIEKGYNAIKVQYQDGIVQLIHINDAAHLILGWQFREKVVGI